MGIIAWVMNINEYPSAELLVAGFRMSRTRPSDGSIYRSVWHTWRQVSNWKQPGRDNSRTRKTSTGRSSAVAMQMTRRPFHSQSTEMKESVLTF